MVALDSVFPILKPNAWAQASNSASMLVQNFPPHDEESSDKAPVLAFCLDKGDTVTIVQQEDLAPNLTLQRLHGAALQNLEYATSEIGWDEIDMNEHVEGMKILILGGNFYASEAILLPNRMMQAHRRLGARRLFACVPSRGRLIVTPAADENSDAAGVFIAGCVSEFYSMSEESPVSPIIWVIEEGEIAGHLEVPADIEDKLASQSLPTEASNSATGEEVEVAQYEVEDDDGIRLRLIFEGTDPDVLVEAFESVMKDTILQVTEQAMFNGKIQASLVMGHGHTIEQQKLESDIEAIVVDYKSKIASEGLKAASGAPLAIAAHVTDTTADLQYFPKSVDMSTPAAEVSKAVIKQRQVFEPAQVAVGGLVGTPVAACLMMALNYRACDKENHALKAASAALVLVPIFAASLALLQSSGVLVFFMLIASALSWYWCRSFPGADFKSIPKHSVTKPLNKRVALICGGAISAVLLNYAAIVGLAYVL